MLTRLVALQHADSAFPSGSFAFSNGLEGLASLPLPFDRASLQAFVEATLKHRWATTDRRALVHVFRACGDIERICEIDATIEAATLSQPLRSGSRRAGRALLTTHQRLGTANADGIATAIKTGRLLGHLATMQGCLWQTLGIGEDEAAAIAGYQVVAGLLSAAVRLGRIGAIEAQMVVRDMLPVLDLILRVPVSTETPLELESFAPLADIAAMRGVGVGTRLFSN